MLDKTDPKPVDKVEGGINWWAEILDIWDQPIPLEGKINGNMTLRYVVVEALGGGYPGEDGIAGDKRATRWSLATRIKELVPGKQIKLKADEIVTIKEVVPKRWPQSFVIAQVFWLIDPGESK